MRNREPKIPRRQVRKNYNSILSQIKAMIESQEISDEGEWITSRDQKFLRIQAPDYYTLGQLEGLWLKSKIKNLKRIIRAVANLFRYKGYSYNRFLEMAQEYEEVLSDEDLTVGKGGNYIDEVQGMADAIPNISFEDIWLQNSFIDLMYGQLFPKFKIFPQEFEFGCTSLGAINPCLAQPVIAGQNFDFNITFKPSLSFVAHQVGDSPWVFGLRMGGILSLPAGINQYGVAAFINIVKCTEPATITAPSGFRTRYAFCHARTAEDYLRQTIKTPNPAGYNLMLSDPHELISIQAIPPHQITRKISRWVVTSNTYTEMEFQKFLLEREYSKHRQIYTETRLEQEYLEGMNEERLMHLLSDAPVISRNHNKAFESRTLAFITRQHFGIGNPTDDAHGEIPKL